MVARLDTVLLDAGGVLVRPNWPRIADLLGARGIAADAARLDGAELLVMRELDDPEVIRRTDDASRLVRFFGRCLDHAGVDEAVEPREAAIAVILATHERENLWEAVPAEVVGALQRLRARGLRLVVVSNANGTVRAKLARLGLGHLFDLVVDSAEEGIEKPDPRIFRAALERVGSRPEAAVHVGDLYGIDVVGARAAGIRAVLLDRAGLYAGFDAPRVTDLADFEARLDDLQWGAVTTRRS